MRRLAASLAVAAQLLAGPALAGEAPPSLGEFVERASARLAAAAEALRPRPPRRVRPEFRARPLATPVDDDVLAAAAGSLDGDGRAELVLLTAREVLVLRVEAASAAIIARATMTGRLAVPRPRDPVGTLEVADRDGDGVREIAARSSELAEGVVLTLAGDKLVEVARPPGFPLCGGQAELVPGRNYFARDRMVGPAVDRMPVELYTASCPRDLIDERGRPLGVVAAVDLADRLTVDCRRVDGKPCRVPPEMVQVGDAVALADLDGDGDPELGFALAGRGGGDATTVWTAARGPRRLDARSIRGRVQAIAAGDFAGDGVHSFLTLEREPGAPMVSLWRLN